MEAQKTLGRNQHFVQEQSPIENDSSADFCRPADQVTGGNKTIRVNDPCEPLETSEMPADFDTRRHCPE